MEDYVVYETGEKECGFARKGELRMVCGGPAEWVVGSVKSQQFRAYLCNGHARILPEQSGVFEWVVPQRIPAGSFALGGVVWPGLAKVVEECGELLQVAGKLMAYPDGEHPDGGVPLLERLCDEIADVTAALFVFRTLNGIDRPGSPNDDLLRDRVFEKAALFHQWHDAQSGS